MTRKFDYHKFVHAFRVRPIPPAFHMSGHPRREAGIGFRQKEDDGLGAQLCRFLLNETFDIGEELVG